MKVSTKPEQDQIADGQTLVFSALRMTALGRGDDWAPALCGRCIKFGSLATIAACRLRVWGAAYAGAIVILRLPSRIGNDRFRP